MNTTRRTAASTSALVTAPVAMLAAAAWLASSAIFSMPNQADGTVAAPIRAMATPAAATGGWIDHSVLDDADRLPAPNPSPLAVAAYDA
jgi:hypothetical protein